MGVIDSLLNSAVVVAAGILGFGLLLAGGQEAAFGSETVGGIEVLIGIILLVFAGRY